MPGGGVALIQAGNSAFQKLELTGDESTGAAIVRRLKKVAIDPHRDYVDAGRIHAVSGKQVLKCSAQHDEAVGALVYETLQCCFDGCRASAATFGAAFRRPRTVKVDDAWRAMTDERDQR